MYHRKTNYGCMNIYNYYVLDSYLFSPQVFFLTFASLQYEEKKQLKYIFDAKTTYILVQK